MKKVKVILTGGFLGAGKTTSVIKMADIFKEKGIKAGIITNDQGNKLVDGRLVNSKDIPSLEVTGGCFCCRFEDLMRGLDKLIEDFDPDVLIAEPVGSCTDLVATVFIPLIKHYPGKFILSPYSVVTDGILLQNILSGNNFPFSQDIHYLYEKQIEESNIVLVNKIDLMSELDVQYILNELSVKYPDKNIMPISAVTGDGFGRWIEYLLDGDITLNPLQEIDYEKYGCAEALLGWYNASVSFSRELLFDANDFIKDLLEGISTLVEDAGRNIAHLKAIAESEGGIIKASIVHAGKNITFDKTAYDLTRTIDLIINARAEVDPNLLKDVIDKQLEKSRSKFKLSIKFGYVECFKPSYPSPTYSRSVNTDDSYSK